MDANAGAQFLPRQNFGTYVNMWHMVSLS